jgi:Uri superfamily endonuclease
MVPTARPDSGLYILVIRLRRAALVRAGALGTFPLEPGWYLYVGSARRALRSRVARHASRGKPLRWHVDHLTERREARVVAALLLPGTRRTECSLSRAVGRLPGMSAPVRRFGASDCKARCPAHLWYSRTRIELDVLVESFPQGVRELF